MPYPPVGAPASFVGYPSKLCQKLPEVDLRLPLEPPSDDGQERSAARSHGNGELDETVRPSVAALVTEATITCPICGFSKREVMPVDACQRSYPCEGCQTMLNTRPGDCCIFCSYADVVCPPEQAEAGVPSGRG